VRSVHVVEQLGGGSAGAVGDLAGATLAPTLVLRYQTPGGGAVEATHDAVGVAREMGDDVSDRPPGEAGRLPSGLVGEPVESGVHALVGGSG
jgi:hypothetical protein